MLGFAAGVGLSVTPGTLRAHQRIAIPTGPMRLTRRIERSLSGGAALTVERSWQVDFAQQGQGVRIVGQQLDARVDAPPSLAPLARIEESRSTDEMWPILLSDTGLILAAGNSLQQEDVNAAVRAAEQMIAARDIPASLKAAQLEYLPRLQQAGASLLETLPADLFYPKLGPQQTARAIDLPDGLTGEFVVSYDARACDAGGWLERAVRRVVTRIGDSERHALEEWLLAAA